MTPEARTAYEQANFSALSPDTQFRIAREKFNNGGNLTGAQASIIDKAYGNADGTLDQKDLEKIEKERNSMGPLKMLAGATSAVFVVDFASRPDFRLGEGGPLRTLFSNIASGTENTSPQEPGFATRLARTFIPGLDNLGP